MQDPTLQQMLSFLQQQQQTFQTEMYAQMQLSNQRFELLLASRGGGTKKKDPPVYEGKLNEDLELWIFATEEYYASMRQLVQIDTSDFVTMISSNLGTSKGHIAPDCQSKRDNEANRFINNNKYSVLELEAEARNEDGVTQPVSVFIGNGGSLNGVSEELVQKLGLKVQEMPNSVMKVDLGFEVRGHFQVMPVPEGNDVILGMLWLTENNPNIDWTNFSKELRKGDVECVFVVNPHDSEKAERFKQQGKLWKEEDIPRAIQEHAQGINVGTLASKYNIPKRTLHRKIAMHKSGIVDKSPGPSPILGDAEHDLYDWAVGMQCKGYPVSRPMLLIEGQEVYFAIFSKTRAVGKIGLACSLETKAESDRIFNMDETAFVQNAKTKRVVALRGSSNVWSRTAETSFHLIIVACGSASGFMMPPLFILPGKRINRDVLDACAVPRARVTTTDTAFTNADLIIRWIAYFAAEVPTPLRRPLVLFLDGASSHMDACIDAQAVACGVQLVQIPANASHLFQPLDVSVFRGFKSALKHQICKFMLSTGKCSINKKEAVTLASVAWQNGVVAKPGNIAAGFKEAGIFPLSRPAMGQRLGKFSANGTSKPVVSPSWLKQQEVIRNEILVLPAAAETKPRRRKTVDVKRRVWTCDDLNDED
ncbi:TPA: hypothetical protein N0F65_004685 [Lagenidium giganteum]|uniref:DDE-1 domain-containing protein n=1 Tax=Lagenidium giganteum TaxID=4803 RepID=A0AAV2Z4Q6_9STRA|nr:TPA: hypothetical protein N0F65_004685 [Lagenidium giganteum]